MYILSVKSLATQGFLYPMRLAMLPYNVFGSFCQRNHFFSKFLANGHVFVIDKNLKLASALPMANKFILS
jgi:hypothetical protein